MKTLNTKMMILVAAFSVMGVGCGSNKMVADSSAVSSGPLSGSGSIPTSPDGSTTSGGTSYSNEATFTPVSIAEFNSYVGTHPLNDPQNFKVKVQLQQVENGRYAGTVNISYTDTGYAYNGTFTAGAGRNVSYSGLNDNNALESEFNRWFTLNGQTAFSGFFQDSYGAIVLVIDNVVNQGDAQGTGDVITGSIYYKNFAQSYAQQSPYRSCWYITNGPYNCRSTSVINKSSTVPSDGYRKLGTFSGISRAASFQ
ncbi:MAG: hypothetical protein ACM3MG_00670 [Bacillota bacterium]